jgi:hypothetical protein
LDEPYGFKSFNDQNFSIKSLFKYSADDVDGQLDKDLFVRSAAGKSMMNQNKKLFVFILHGNTIYRFTDGKD